MANNRRRTYREVRRKRPAGERSSHSQEKSSVSPSSSRAEMSRRDYERYVLNKRRRKMLRERRRKAQRRRRRLFLLVLLLVLVFTGKSFLQHNKQQTELEEIPVTSVEPKEPKETKKTASQENTVTSSEKPVFGTADRDTWIKNIQIAAQTNPNAQKIVDHVNDVPDAMLKLAGNNFDAIDFVAKSIDPAVENKYSYPENITGTKFPYYIQWDDRWGYDEYAGGVIGHTGCAPTVMAMAVSGITGDKMTPTQMAEFSEKNGFSNDSGTSWDYYPKVAQKYGLKIDEISNDDKMKKDELEKGHVLIISVKPGRFTQVGHVMMIVGVDKDGKYIIQDPNSLQNTKKHWTFDQLTGDLKKIWSLYK